MDNIEKISNIAAEWWADVIVNPKMDNGDNSREGAIGNILQRMLVKPIEEDKRNQFKKNLKDYIFEKLYDYSDIQRLYLDVDYGPCAILAQLAEYSDISENNFPIKTTMAISKHHIEVSYGYGSPYKILFADSFYYEKQIKDVEESIEYYKNKDDDYFTIGTREEILEELDGKLINYKQQLKSLEV